MSNRKYMQTGGSQLGACPKTFLVVTAGSDATNIQWVERPGMLQQFIEENPTTKNYSALNVNRD